MTFLVLLQVSGWSTEQQLPEGISTVSRVLSDMLSSPDDRLRDKSMAYKTADVFNAHHTDTVRKHCIR